VSHYLLDTSGYSVFFVVMLVFSKTSALAGSSVFLLLQLRCVHLVLAKVPLPEEAIFNRNKAAVERWHAARKAYHKEREIANRDQNNNRIKRRITGERGVSSN
jgi:hypothetical protein